MVSLQVAVYRHKIHCNTQKEHGEDAGDHTCITGHMWLPCPLSPANDHHCVLMRLWIPTPIVVTMKSRTWSGSTWNFGASVLWPTWPLSWGNRPAQMHADTTEKSLARVREEEAKIFIGNKGDIAQFSSHQKVPFSNCRSGHIHESRVSKRGMCVYLCVCICVCVCVCVCVCAIRNASCSCYQLPQSASMLPITTWGDGCGIHICD